MSDSQDEPIYIEMEFAKKGLNPVFGEWSRTFNYPSVSYSSPKRKDFQNKLAAEFSDVHFLFSHDVKVEITLYQFHQKRLETPDYGDLDNHAKSICDAIKGASGIMIDDCQVQQLDICWNDIPDFERFEIRLRGSPDDFTLKPVEFYEMSNGLYYPFSKRYWTQQGPQEMNDTERKVVLDFLWEMVSKSKKIRHDFRQLGETPINSFWASRKIHPVIEGYHKSRLFDCGFKIYEKSEWRK